MEFFDGGYGISVGVTDGCYRDTACGPIAGDTGKWLDCFFDVGWFDGDWDDKGDIDDYTIDPEDSTVNSLINQFLDLRA